MQAGQYAAAWECATVNRMDLSLIAAHAWPRFLAAAPKFVAAVPKDQDLVDFMTSLQPHNARSGLAVQLKALEQVGLACNCSDGRENAALLVAFGAAGQQRWSHADRTCRITAR